MATEKREFIDPNELMRYINENHSYSGLPMAAHICTMELLTYAPRVNAVEIPCKIGDVVWAIRNIKGKKHPQRGIVSDMYYLKDMSLQIVVKYVARGEWGKTVFATDKEAYSAIGERKDNG